MPYTRTQWQNEITKLNAKHLNNIEDGIEEALALASEAGAEADTVNLKVNQASQDIVALRTKTSQDITTLRNETSQNVESLRAETSQNIETLGTKTSQDIEALRSEIPTKITDLENDSNFATKDELFSKSYNDLSNKPFIPTAVSQLVNDSTFASKNYVDQKATELAENKADKSEVTAQNNRIKIIENNYIKSVEYESGTGIFRFTMQDGTIKTMDLAIEKVVTNFKYDATNTSLKLTLADGTAQFIPLSDFITDYTGSENDQIQVLVQNENKIAAILKDNSVTLTKISNEVKEYFASKNDVANQIGDIKSILATLVEV